MRYTIEIQLREWDGDEGGETLKSMDFLDVSDIPDLIDAKRYAEKVFEGMTTLLSKPYALSEQIFRGLGDPNR